jgi:hypothetical protein
MYLPPRTPLANVNHVQVELDWKLLFSGPLQGLRVTFKKGSDIFNNHQKIASHTDNLGRVKLSKLNNFGLMTKLLIDTIIYMVYIMIK